LLGGFAVLLVGAWSALPKMAVCRIGEPHTALLQIRHAAREAWAGHPERCPVYSDLQVSEHLDPAFARGLSDAHIRIKCTDTEVTVRWVGTDARFDTDDDMVIPYSHVADTP
jgi:hypothetical protein